MQKGGERSKKEIKQREARYTTEKEGERTQTSQGLDEDLHARATAKAEDEVESRRCWCLGALAEAAKGATDGPNSKSGRVQTVRERHRMARVPVASGEAGEADAR